MANTRALPETCKLPCPYCCKPVSFPKATFIKGGVVKCQKCGMSFRLQPHKNGGRKKPNLKKWQGKDPDGVKL